MRLTLADIEAARGDYEPFELDLGDDDVLTLPHPKQLPLPTLLQLGDTSSPEQATAQMLSSNEAWQAFIRREDLQIQDFEFVTQQYAKCFDLGTPGEGDASPRSSSGTARPSKSTSRAKAKA